MNLKDRVILITGASSGIGRESARQLALQGAQLALAARRKNLLEELAQDLQERYNTNALSIPTDITKTADIQQMIQKTIDHFGRLDVLINNAGVLYMEPFLTMPLEDIQTLMHTNFLSVIHTIRMAVPYLAKNGTGHIINVGSGVSRRGIPFMAAYSASKFALAGLTESLRLEMAAQNIKFTMIYPGGVDTDMPKSVNQSKLPPGEYTHIKGIPVEKAARAIVTAVHTQPLEIYVPRWVRWGAWISVLCPSFVDWLIQKIRMPRSPSH